MAPASTMTSPRPAPDGGTTPMIVSPPVPASTAPARIAGLCLRMTLCSTSPHRPGGRAPPIPDTYAAVLLWQAGAVVDRMRIGSPGRSLSGAGWKMSEADRPERYDAVKLGFPEKPLTKRSRSTSSGGILDSWRSARAEWDTRRRRCSGEALRGRRAQRELQEDTPLCGPAVSK